MVFKAKPAAFKPTAGYFQEDWDEVSDNPELTDEQLAQGRPFIETMPKLAAAIARERVERGKATTIEVTLQLDQRVIDYFRAAGPDWRFRMNAALLTAAGFGEAGKRR